MASNILKNRRDFLGGAAVAAAGAAAVGSGLLAGIGAAVARVPAPTDPFPTAGLLEGVAFHRPFSGSWLLTGVYGPVAGGLTLVIQEGASGRPVRVDLCLRGDEVRAPAFTKYLELYVMDGGEGRKRMDEELVDALGDLAAILEENEVDPRLLEGILTFEERWELYPEFMARAACELAPGVSKER